MAVPRDSYIEPILCTACGHEMGRRPRLENVFPPTRPFPLPSKCERCGADARVPKARFVKRAIIATLVAVPLGLAWLLWFMLRATSR